MHTVQRLTCSFQKWIGIAAAYPATGARGRLGAGDTRRPVGRRVCVWLVSGGYDPLYPGGRSPPRRQPAGADIEDIVQEVLLALHPKRGT